MNDQKVCIIDPKDKYAPYLLRIINKPDVYVWLSNHHPWNIEKVLRRFKSGIFKIIVVQRKIAGFINVRYMADLSNPKEKGFYLTIAIDPKYHGQGISRKAFELFMKYLPKDIFPIGAIVSNENVKSLHFLNKLGFEHIKTFMFNNMKYDKLTFTL